MSLSWKAGFAKKKPERREEKRDCKTGVIIRSWAAVIRHVNISHVESTYSVSFSSAILLNVSFNAYLLHEKKKNKRGFHRRMDVFQFREFIHGILAKAEMQWFLGGCYVSQLEF